jgi:VWFA-related protein
MATNSLYVRAGAISAAALVLIAGWGSRAIAQRETREQHTFATVTDKKNTPVNGLTVADFTVREDDVKREILKVEPATAPMQVVLLVDTSDSTRSLTHDLRSASSAFINAVFNANSQNQMAIYTFGERPTKLTDFSATPIPLLRAADGLFPAQGSGSYFNDSFRDVTQALTKAGAKRPVIVAFVNEGGIEFSNSDHNRVAQALQASHAALWTVTLPDRQAIDRGLGNPNEAQARIERSRIIDDLTVQSGGENVQVVATTALAQAFTDLAKLLASQYDITYARPDSMVPPKKIDVQVSRPDTKLIAPRWSGK